MPARTANAARARALLAGRSRRSGARCSASRCSRERSSSARGDALIAYGRLATIGAFVAAITQVLIGFWSDARRRGGSRRVEFYVVGAIGGAAALTFFYDASTLLALTVAFIALQAALNVAIGPYQAIIPDFVERSRTGVASSWMAALQGAGNAVGALLRAFILKRARARRVARRAAARNLRGDRRHTPRVCRCAMRRAEARRASRVTRPFVDLFISRALVYVGFYTLLGYLLFYVTAVLGVVDACRRAPRDRES